MENGGLSLHAVAGSGRSDAKHVVLSMANNQLYMRKGFDLQVLWGALENWGYDVRAALDDDRDPTPFPNAAGSLGRGGKRQQRSRKSAALVA